MQVQSGRYWSVMLLAVIPALFCAYVIYAYGVNVPYWDDWFVGPPLFQKMAKGEPFWMDLFSQHNEHRIAVSRLIVLATAPLTNWNLKALMWVSFALAGLTSLGIYRLARCSTKGHQGTALLFFLANMVLFSLAQYENWLWGMQIQFFLPNFFLVWALWLTLTNWPRWIVFPTVILLSILATFTSAHGMISWLTVILPLAWSPSWRELFHKKWWLLAWLIAFLASLFFYLDGYQIPHQQSSLNFTFMHPITALHFLLAFFGNPLGSGNVIGSTLLGSLLLGAFLYMTIYMIWQRHDYSFIKTMLVWWSLGIYALGCGGMIMAGRLRYGGIIQAFVSRYSTLSQWMILSVLFGLFLIYLDARKKNFHLTGTLHPFLNLLTRVYAPLLAILGLTFVVTITITNFRGLKYCEETRIRRLAARSNLLLLDYIPPENEYLLPYILHSSLNPYAQFLNQRGYLQPSLINTNDISKLCGPDDQATSVLGLKGKTENIVLVAPNRYVVTGWAAFTKLERPVDSVLLTCENATTPATILGLAEVGYVHAPQTDAQNAGKRIGWQRDSTFPTTLPHGTWQLRAWAIDSSSGKIFPLEGTIPFSH